MPVYEKFFYIIIMSPDNMSMERISRKHPLTGGPKVQRKWDEKDDGGSNDPCKIKEGKWKKEKCMDKI